MQFKYRSVALGVAMSTFWVHASTGQESFSPLEEITVISSRIPQPLRQVGTSVSIISEADIEAHGNLSLTDVLRQMPGLATTGNGGAGKATTLRIRGEEGFRTLTIFDGIRLQDPSGVQIGPHLEHMLSNGVGRVEVLRGPQGLSYGADAGGVVNVSSRQIEQGVNTQLSAQSGSYDTQQYSGNISAAYEQLDLFLSVADYQTDGFNTRPSDFILADDDGYENTTVHTRIGFNATEQLRFDVVHREVRGDSKFDGCYAGITVHDCTSDYDLTATRLSVNYETESFSHSLSYASTETDREIFALGSSSFVAAGEINRIEYAGSATNLPGFNLAFGIDLEEAKDNATSRDNLGIYLEYLSDFSDTFYLTAGLRHDDNDDFGTNTSYRVSTAYLVDFGDDATVKFKASIGTGFRAPSPYEVSTNSSSFAFPPASLVTLQQEESKGYELGIEYILGNELRMEMVYFDQEVENAITYDLAFYSGYLQDEGASSSKGVELSGQYQLSEDVSVTANYTYNDTERPNGLQRLRRPEQLANIGVSYYALADKLSINAFYRISRDSIDEVFSSVTKLDDFEVLDLSANYQLTDSAQIYARLENAFDENYQEVYDYNTAERAAYVGFNMSFSSL